MKIKVKQILLKDGEGKREWFPKTFGSWEGFESYIAGLRLQCSELGYYKTNVEVTFDDGFKYAARYEFYKQWQKNKSLRLHIRQHCEFYTGENKPNYLTPEQYESCLNMLGAERTETTAMYKEILEKYDV